MAGDGDAVNENVFNFSGRGFDVSVFDEAKWNNKSHSHQESHQESTPPTFTQSCTTFPNASVMLTTRSAIATLLCVSPPFSVFLQGRPLCNSSIYSEDQWKIPHFLSPF
jgi:hypothetical protein